MSEKGEIPLVEIGTVQEQRQKKTHKTTQVRNLHKQCKMILRSKMKDSEYTGEIWKWQGVIRSIDV